MTTEGLLDGGATAPEASPPPESPTPESAPEAKPSTGSWMDGLPDELKTDGSIRKFENITDLAKSYSHLEKLSRSSNKVSIPDKHHTEEDWKQLFHKLGNPETIEEYDLNVPENSEFDEGFLNGFREVAHAAGVLPRQAQKLIEWYNTKAQEHVQSLESSFKGRIEEAQAQLKEEWGVGYDQKLKFAKDGIKYAGGAEVLDTLKQVGLDSHPAIVKAFSKLGEMTAEDHGIKGEAGKPITSDDYVKKAKQITENPNHPYWDKTHPGHKSAVEEVTQLYRLAFPEDQ